MLLLLVVSAAPEKTKQPALPAPTAAIYRALLLGFSFHGDAAFYAQNGALLSLLQNASESASNPTEALLPIEHELWMKKLGDETLLDNIHQRTKALENPRRGYKNSCDHEKLPSHGTNRLDLCRR